MDFAGLPAFADPPFAAASAEVGSSGGPGAALKPVLPGAVSSSTSSSISISIFPSDFFRGRERLTRRFKPKTSPNTYKRQHLLGFAQGKFYANFQRLEKTRRRLHGAAWIEPACFSSTAYPPPPNLTVTWLEQF